MNKLFKVNIILLVIAALILIGKIYNLPTEMARAQIPAISYNVYVDGSGNLSGFAWSDNIGWIKFGGISGFPIYAGTVAQNAQLVSNQLIGWARACAGTASGDCSSMVSRTDGWDGWVSLGGSNYGVTLNGQNFSGFSWGSDVVGWIDFSSSTNNINGVKLFSIVPITINLNSNPLSVITGNSSIISWSSTGADSCSVVKNGAAFSSGLSNAGISSGLLTVPTTFTIQCDNLGNSGTKSISIDVTAHPPLVLRIEPSQIIWSDTTPGDTCILTQDGVIISTQTSGNIVNDNLQAGSIILLTCTSPGGTVLTSSIQSVAPAVRSTCIPLQGTSTEMYVNRNTTWTTALSTSSVTSVSTDWSGTNIPATISLPGLSGLVYNKIYTTVGTKNITITTSGIRSDNTPFTSTCSTSTIMKLDPGITVEL